VANLFKVNTPANVAIDARREKSEARNNMLHHFPYGKCHFLRHYHRRSNVGTTFNTINATFGSRNRLKDPIAATNQALRKVLCHDPCALVQSAYELGIESEF
jgi:hypothetical protein